MNKAMDRFKLNATPAAHLQSISSGIKMLFSSFISRSRSSISLYVYNWFTSQNKWCISGDAACETCDRQFSTKTETHPIHCENSKREAEQYITRYHVGSCWSYYILLLFFFLAVDFVVSSWRSAISITRASKSSHKMRIITRVYLLRVFGVGCVLIESPGLIDCVCSMYECICKWLWHQQPRDPRIDHTQSKLIKQKSKKIEGIVADSRSSANYFRWICDEHVLPSLAILFVVTIPIAYNCPWLFAAFGHTYTRTWSGHLKTHTHVTSHRVPMPSVRQQRCRFLSPILFFEPSLFNILNTHLRCAEESFFLLFGNCNWHRPGWLISLYAEERSIIIYIYNVHTGRRHVDAHSVRLAFWTALCVVCISLPVL